MLSIEEALGGTAAPTPVGVETPTSVAARMLELAAVTADQLVADARTESESLVSTAQARAEAIVEASRTEADRVAAALARAAEEQTADLERERVAALAGLTDEKAALEAQLAVLGQMESDHRSQLRHHLTQHLSLLDATLPQPPTAIAG